MGKKKVVNRGRFNIRTQRTITGVDSVVVVVEDVVENVAVTESERGGTRVKVVPVVGGICDGDWGVLSTVAVGVANKRGFPVGVELAVRDSHSRAAVGDVEETIVANIEMLVDAKKTGSSANKS